MKFKHLKLAMAASGILLSMNITAFSAPYPKIQGNKTNGNIEKVFFGRPNCPTNVIFKYQKPTHKVENHKNIQGFSKKKMKGKQKLGGQTRYSGLTWTMKKVSRGCGQGVEFQIKHRSHVRVIMPNKSSMLACNYNAILKHEMEHVKIYRDTPLEYEKKFKAILANYSGAALNSQLSRLSNEISADMKKRNDKFHDKHGAVYTLKRSCG